ncbi:DUF535 family protein [Massilia sp. DWR3-1-1]|uniref:DUF535 family protein n=1 Tax=Massilia sp. DWR3-1-1 TaxID=2804559 RepID=UPI003CEB7603
MQASISLCSGLRTELRGFKLLRESFKLVSRAVLFRRQTAHWLALLNSDPLFAQMLPSCPRLINKIYRQYLSTRLGCDERLDALQTHYRTVIERGLAPLVARAAAAPVTMCQLQVKDGEGENYRIELRAGGVLSREGELIFQLMHEDRLLYSVACSFVRDGAGKALGVGCLQGTPGPGAQDGVRAATRALHGMRPKNLLMRVVRQFGHEQGCSHLLLVGNANRVVTTSMRKGKVHADYDTLWRELGARCHADGDFRLACEALPALDVTEIASKKRSEAKKRHEMIKVAVADIDAQVRRSQRALTALRLAPSAAGIAPPTSHLRRTA